MTTVALDTNEYISAFHFRGKSLHLLRMAADGDIEIAISEPIIKELIRVLREKFNRQHYELHEIRPRLVRITRLVEPKQKLAVVADDPDNRILECAEEAGSDYIITRTRHSWGCANSACAPGQRIRLHLGSVTQKRTEVTWTPVLTR